MNKMHFYVARDKDGSLWLYMGKPVREDREFYSGPGSKVFALACHSFNCFGLSEDDYAKLKWEDEPVEVFLNLED